jgi:hypothetical protein
MPLENFEPVPFVRSGMRSIPEASKELKTSNTSFMSNSDNLAV